MCAASTKRGVKVVKLLIQKVAKLDLQCNTGSTALIESVSAYLVMNPEVTREVVIALVEAGADLHIKDRSNRTVLDHAACDSKHMVSYLQQVGAEYGCKEAFWVR